MENDPFKTKNPCREIPMSEIWNQCKELYRGMWPAEFVDENLTTLHFDDVEEIELSTIDIADIVPTPTDSTFMGKTELGDLVYAGPKGYVTQKSRSTIRSAPVVIDYDPIINYDIFGKEDVSQQAPVKTKQKLSFTEWTTDESDEPFRLSDQHLQNYVDWKWNVSGTSLNYPIIPIQKQKLKGDIFKIYKDMFLDIEKEEIKAKISTW